MPPKYQKQLKGVVQRWQQGLAITIGPFETLNYETATNVCTAAVLGYCIRIIFFVNSYFGFIILHFIAYQENLLAFDAAFLERELVSSIDLFKE